MMIAVVVWISRIQCCFRLAVLVPCFFAFAFALCWYLFRFWVGHIHICLSSHDCVPAIWQSDGMIDRAVLLFQGPSVPEVEEAGKIDEGDDTQVSVS